MKITQSILNNSTAVKDHKLRILALKISKFSNINILLIHQLKYNVIFAA